MIFKQVNKKILSLTLSIFFLLSYSLFAFNPSSKQWKKIDKYIFKNFNIEVEKKSIPITLFESSHIQLYSLNTKNSIIGYLVLDRAPSKFEEFDFMVILDTEINIELVRVITYREDWGMEICNKRWLKQFVQNDRNTVNSMLRVDGISGSTISVNSLTRHIELIIKNTKTYFKE